MKRLLAYLFIVLGLGLTFSANAETIYDIKSKNKAKIVIEAFEPTNYEQFVKNKINFEEIKLIAKDHCKTNISDWDLNFKYGVKKNGKYYPEGVKSITYTFDCNKNKTQIAKAEPSQTQKVADINFGKSWDFKEVGIKFCMRDNKRYGGNNNYTIIVSSKRCIDQWSGNWDGSISQISYDEYIKANKGGDKNNNSLKICYRPRASQIINNVDKEHVNAVLIEEDCISSPRKFYEIKYIRDASTTNNTAIFVQAKTQIAKAEPTIKPKKKVKVAKVEDSTQEEFKPEKTNQDNEAPVIEIAENITVDSQTYTLKGKVKDKSRFQLTIDDRPIKVSKNGEFKFEGFAIDSKEQLKIVATDKWRNKSEKTINIKVEFKQTADTRSYEKPNPNNIRTKTDNDKIGIIIGIEKYQALSNLDAPYANRDANAFRAYATRALGIPDKNLKVLIDNEANRSGLLKALKIWLPQMTRGKEKDIYIFFAGHGLASDDGKDLHILPQDGDPILLEETALSRVQMFDLINKVSPKSVTMFFDTCYSGQTRDEGTLVAGLRPLRIVADEQDTPNNFTIFTASNYDQTSGSINEAEHGIFSYYLMKGLEGNADANKDKKLTNGELIAYLKNNVSQEAFTQNRSQEPMLAGNPDKILMSYR